MENCWGLPQITGVKLQKAEILEHIGGAEVSDIWVFTVYETIFTHDPVRPGETQNTILQQMK